MMVALRFLIADNIVLIIICVFGLDIITSWPEALMITREHSAHALPKRVQAMS